MIKTILANIVLALVLLAGVASADVTHTGRPQDSVVQDYVDYAYKVSGGDIDFLATLDAENGRRDSKRRSNVTDKRTKQKEDSRGFCQLHRKRHKKIVDDPRFFTDPKRQIEQCWKKYKGGTRFYGYDVRHKSKKRFVVDGQKTTTLAGKVEVKKTVASLSTGCHYIGFVPAGKTLQADRHILIDGVYKFFDILFRREVAKDEKILVHYCP